MELSAKTVAIGVFLSPLIGLLLWVVAVRLKRARVGALTLELVNAQREYAVGDTLHLRMSMTPKCDLVCEQVEVSFGEFQDVRMDSHNRKNQRSTVCLWSQEQVIWPQRRLAAGIPYHHDLRFVVPPPPEREKLDVAQILKAAGVSDPMLRSLEQLMRRSDRGRELRVSVRMKLPGIDLHDQRQAFVTPENSA
jgi:hypothetical protein